MRYLQVFFLLAIVAALPARGQVFDLEKVRAPLAELSGMWRFHNLTAGGTVTAANAGHLAPDVDSAELPVDNGLPLGVDPNAGYSETVFQLAPNVKLTLLTDGVVEARNSTGELFGFDRTRFIAGEPAQTVAEAARSFGQEDDITVLSLERMAADRLDPVSESRLSPAPA